MTLAKFGLVIGLCLSTASMAYSDGAPAVDGVYAPPSTASLKAAFATASTPLDDPRIARWNTMVQAGEYASLISETEADLRSNSPHPYAEHVWSTAQWGLGALGDGVFPEYPSDLADTLEYAARAFAYERLGQNGLLAQMGQGSLARPAVSYWADYEIAYGVCGVAQNQLCRDLSLRLLQAYPNDFGVAWLTGSYAEDGRADLLAKVSALPESAGRALTTWMLKNNVYTYSESRAVSRAWLDHVPNDPHALRRYAYQFESQDKHAEALKLFQAEHAAYPLRDAPERVARAKARLRDFSGAFQTLNAWISVAEPVQNRPWRTTVALTKALRIAGELGRARETALKGREISPDNIQIQIELARVLESEGFPLEVLDVVEPLMAVHPTDLEVASQYFDALYDAEMSLELVPALQEYMAAGGTMTPSFVNTWRRALNNLDRPQDVAEALDYALQHFPETHWMVGNFAWSLNKNGDKQAAYDLLVDLANRQAPMSWRAKLLREIGQDLGQSEELVTLFDGFATKYPYSEYVWRELGKVNGDPVATWDRAAKMAPGLVFPVVKKAYEVAQDDYSNWASAYEIMNDAIDAAQLVDLEAGQMIKLYDTRSAILDSAHLKRQVYEPDLITIALEDLDKARALGMSEDDYWSNRFYTIGRVGPSKERSAAALQMVRYAPDNMNRIAHLFDGKITQFFGNGALGFPYLDIFVSRSPRDSERLEDAAHRQNKWGGSAVVALSLLERAKRWNPDADVNTEMNYAYSYLGAHQRHYEFLYTKGEKISSSLRYVNWWERARKNARGEQNTIKSLDLENMRVVLLRPDGIEEERRYDPVLGRQTFLRVGAAVQHIDYTSDGYMTGIRMGSRMGYVLEYSAPTNDGLNRYVIRMEMPDGQEMLFDYNENGNVTRLEIVGKGHMDISYDEHGEISETNAIPLDPDYNASQFALDITRGFQDLLRVVRSASGKGGDQFSESDLQDEQVDGLRNKLYEDNEDMDWADYLGLQIDLAATLLDKIADFPGYADESTDLLREVYYQAATPDYYEEEPVEAQEPTAQELVQLAKMEAHGVTAVRLYHALLTKTRSSGMPLYLWEEWGEMRKWALSVETDTPEVNAARVALNRELENSTLRPMSQAGWLRGSHLSNPGFWRAHDTSIIFPVALSDRIKTRDILVRENGDVVVASNYGISVLRRGFWEWFGFNPSTGGFVTDMDYGALDGSSNFTSLAEDAQGRLWIGGRSGLVMLDGDYVGKATRLKSGRNGLFQGAVDALATQDGQLMAGGSSGLARVQLDTLAIDTIDEKPVTGVRATTDGWLVIGRNHLGWVADAELVKLTDYRVTDAILDQEGVLYILQGKTLTSASMEGVLSGTDMPTPVFGQETIAATAEPYGLAMISVDEYDSGLAVLTDQGASILAQGTFEHMRVPNSDRAIPILDMFEHGKRVFMRTANGVNAVVRGQVSYPSSDRVYALATDMELGVTYMADGGQISVLDHTEDTPRAEYFASADATVLKIAPDGALIANDGRYVLRYARGSTEAQELFYAEQTVPEDFNPSNIHDILVASDGSIWATAGASVFHWQEDQELKEYSQFIDPRFAPNSDMLAGIFESIDGRILLVASSEGHRSYKQRGMKGGLFEFDGTDFVKFEDEVTGRWFMSSYTKLDDKTAVAGTTAGFSVHKGETLVALDRSGNSSYEALKKIQPALYMGTQGAKLGEDLWLFGSAGGVVAMQNGVWFNTDRLNWMLPGQEYANYGSRAVHAVATDSRGRVYVGTDWGLTVYDPDGEGAESFLISEQRGEYAFSALEQQRMGEVNDILLEALPQDTKAGKMATAFRKNRRELAKKEQAFELATAEKNPIAGKLDKQVLRARQRDIALLAKLEKDQPTLFNMLQLNPLDLRALARKLPEDLVIAQYLPTKNALHINLVTSRGATLRSVTVPYEDIQSFSRIAAAAMAAQARGINRGEGDAAASGQRGGVPLFDLSGGEKESAAAIKTNDALVWLYDKLLRPIEHAVPEGATLVVSPSGGLSYVPFAALIRSVQGDTPEFAVQHFDMVTAPSLYAVEMMLDDSPSLAMSHVVFGDPDGTLPAARTEAENVAQILEPDFVELRIGEEASYDELLTYAGDARFVHLAMHGKLDHQSPKDSYLLLAEGRRMSIPQIMTLPLEESELVFLSACESGLGTDGLEYRTIAHAFAHAGAPSVVATLWQVDDAATRKLAEAFYQSKMDGETNATALRTAQRTMIADGGRHSLPGYWAAAMVFGKP